MENSDIYMDNHPWLRDKRAWIFYLDKIEKNENMICGRVDGNVYFMDCETARLSMWIKKWNVFTEFGVGDLLHQVNDAGNRKKKKVFRGTRILYKGIEIQKLYNEYDTELLEYIDIKRELSREHINISRNGFTESGEQYFKETIYPDLLENVKKILAEMRKQAEKLEKEEKDSFINKIYSIAKSLCIDLQGLDDARKLDGPEGQEKQEKLIELIVTSSILAYYATRDTWDIMEALNGYKKNDMSIWQKLLDKLDGLLHNYKEVTRHLAEKTVLFQIKAITERNSEYIFRGERNEYDSVINILTIFLSKKHYAIVQKRDNSFSPWTAGLILLEDKEDKIHTYFELLITLPHTVDAEVEIEEWGNQLCQDKNAIQWDDILEKSDYSMQVFFNWMLKTIPTIAMFSSEDGNTRVNVLSNRIFPSIYMNQNFKMLLVQRIIERAQDDNIQRFSTIAWQGQEKLIFEKLPYSIYFVKRGYLSEYSYHKSIVPFDGQLLCAWGDILKKAETATALQQIKRLCGDMDIIRYLNDYWKNDNANKLHIATYLRKERSSAVLNISSEFMSIVMARIIENGFKCDMDAEELLQDNATRTENWHEMYETMAEIQAREYMKLHDESIDRELVNRLQKNLELESLCCAWMYCCLYKESLLDREIESLKAYEMHISNPVYLDKENKMMDYMYEHCVYSINKNTIKEYIETYKREWLTLVINKEKKGKTQCIEELLSKYKFFTAGFYHTYREKIQEKNR